MSGQHHALNFMLTRQEFDTPSATLDDVANTGISPPVWNRTTFFQPAPRLHTIQAFLTSALDDSE
jgi:hypothetical protein